jgi:hypothetical protein
MKINLKIERLILRGIPLTTTDRTEMTAAIQLELGRLLASAGDSPPWANLDDLPHIQAQSISYHPGSSPIRLGREIAASLHSSIQNSSTMLQSEQS